jgi:hypothetical protein
MKILGSKARTEFGYGLCLLFHLHCCVSGFTFLGVTESQRGRQLRPMTLKCGFKMRLLIPPDKQEIQCVEGLFQYVLRNCAALFWFQVIEQADLVLIYDQDSSLAVEL